MNLVKIFQSSGMNNRLAKVKQMAKDLKEDLDSLKNRGCSFIFLIVCMFNGGSVKETNVYN